MGFKCVKEDELKGISLVVMELQLSNGVLQTVEMGTVPGNLFKVAKLKKVAKFPKVENEATHRIIYIDSPGEFVRVGPTQAHKLEFSQLAGISGVIGSTQKSLVTVEYKPKELFIQGP